MSTLELYPGKEVPVIGLGTWFYGEDPSYAGQEIATIHEALARGPRVIDTAEMYGSGASERIIGRALSSCRDKDNAVLVSKVLPYNASAEGTVAAAEGSLQRLGVDTLDVFLLHWRGSHPFEDTLEGMQRLVDAGKIRSWGVSNMDPQDMAELLNVPGGSAVATNQVLYNPTRRGPELDLFPFLAQADIPVMAYSPVEQGRLFEDRRWRVFLHLAEKYQVTPATVALAWVIRSGQVLAIPMTRSVEHLHSNFAAVTIELEASDLAAIDQAYPAPTHPVPLQML